ncbi:hypothetical protein A2U01_0103651, partial [Trifolium medium]|nr:hypothetical protein [Trifolium medium]
MMQMVERNSGYVWQIIGSWATRPK